MTQRVKDANRVVRVRGVVHTQGGKKYEFSLARLESDAVGISKLIFKTKRVSGTEYGFEGSFLDRPIAAGYRKLH